jgi:hypothetical protein
MNGVLLGHLPTTLFMVGVIRLVYIVHHPLLARTGSKGFAPYSNVHSRPPGFGSAR